MNDILRIREICKAYKSCSDGCPFCRGNDCLVCIPPSNLDDEQLYQIEKTLGYDSPHCQYTDEEIAKSFIEDVEAVKDQLPAKNDLGVECIKKSDAINIIQDMHGLALQG